MKIQNCLLRYIIFLNNDNTINLMLRKLHSFKSTMSKSKKIQKRGGLEIGVRIMQNGPVQMDKNGNILVKILAKPGAKQNSITTIEDDGIGVQIAAPPIEGEANTELIRYLSSVLGLRKSDLALDKGSKSRQKTVLISKGIITVDIVKSLLQKENENG